MATFNTQEFDFSLVDEVADTLFPIRGDQTQPAPLDPNPNALRDYIVIVKEGVTIEDLERDLESDTTFDNLVDSNIVPDRAVEVANRRPLSGTQTHYYLTDDEASRLKNHPSVLDVELNPSINPKLIIKTASIQRSDFTKQALFGTASANTVNWSLIRCSSPNNIYGTSNTTALNYTYTADGSGVDIIIMDSGLKVDHPEFQYANGVSRVQQIDWYAVTGIAGTMPANFYTDDVGHGTAVAGIVAGKTFGWAKNAKIYVMNILGTAGTTIDQNTAFDLMNAFHVNKAIDPVLGVKRPTIVNGSWGINSFIMSGPSPYDPYLGYTIYVGYQIWGGTYRGTAWTGYAAQPAKALDGTNAGTYTLSNGSSSVSGTLYQINGYSTSLDTSLTNMVANGVHYVRSAGNDHTKQDISTGVDYGNFVNILTSLPAGVPTTTPTYYNRPASPWTANSINVSATTSDPYSLSGTISATYSSTTITVTSTIVTGLRVGDVVVITGMTATTNPPNGTWTVTAVPTTLSFRFTSTSTPTGTIAGTIVVKVATLDVRAYWSSYGTAIDLYAPGEGLVTAGIAAGNTYYGNSSYYQINENGTSFSAPTAAGVLALFLQQNPGATPINAKKWMTSNAQGCINSILYDDASSNTYTFGTKSLSGGNNKFLFNQFTASNITIGSNGLTMTGGIAGLKIS